VADICQHAATLEGWAASQGIDAKIFNHLDMFWSGWLPSTVGQRTTSGGGLVLLDTDPVHPTGVAYADIAGELAGGGVEDESVSSAGSTGRGVKQKHLERLLTAPLTQTERPGGRGGGQTCSQLAAGKNRSTTEPGKRLGQPAGRRMKGAQRIQPGMEGARLLWRGLWTLSPHK
jgi:hypothetical protein